MLIQGQPQTADPVVFNVDTGYVFEFLGQGPVPTVAPDTEIQQWVRHTCAIQVAHLAKGKSRRMAAHRVGFQNGNFQTLFSQQIRGKTSRDASTNYYYFLFRPGHQYHHSGLY